MQCSRGFANGLLILSGLQARRFAGFTPRIKNASLVLGALLGLSVWSAAALGSPLCDSLTAGRFDIVYICPASWRADVARLAIHRAGPQAGGYTSIIAPAESIAACYGPGRVGIRGMLHGVLSAWTVPPRHVVLIGGYGMVDTAVFVLPTWYREDPEIGFWTRMVPTDDPYVYTPHATDSIPAVSIGRIPAWSATDLSTYIDKVLTYENAGLPDWKTTALHVIEDRDIDGNDGALARRHADSLATHFGPLESYSFASSDLYGTAAGPPGENAPVLAAWNAGIGYALFYGTSGTSSRLGFLDANSVQCYSPQVWSVEYPRVLLDSLQANGKSTVVFGLTCGCACPNGLFGQPSRCGSLSQYLLFAESKGAISITGPSRAIHEVPGYAIAKAWYQAVFGHGQSGVTREPGVALRSVKKSLIPLLPLRRTEVMEMVVLGDPAVQFYVGSPPVVDVGEGPQRRPAAFAVRQLGRGDSFLRFSVDVPRPGEYSFVLVDIQGRVLSRQTLVASEPGFGLRLEIPTAQRRSGVYFLRGSGAGLVSASKVIILQ